MSVLGSVYLEELPDRDRWGDITNDDTIAVHVAVSGHDIIHLMLEESLDMNSIEVNMTIETAEAVLAGLQAAIASARRGRNLGK